MGQRGDFSVSKGRHAVSNRRLSQLVRVLGMLEGLPGMLVSGFIFGFPLLLPRTVGMGRQVVQLGGALVIFVMRSIVISGGHNL